MLVLVADPDPIMCKTIRFLLSQEGHEVVSATCGSSAVALAEEFSPDLFIVDAALRDLELMDVRARLGGEGLPAITLLLASRSADLSTVPSPTLPVGGLLFKPFEPEDLIHRIRSIVELREGPGASVPGSKFRVGSIELRPTSLKAVIRDGQLVRLVALTPAEMRLAYCLMAHAGQVVSSEKLAGAIKMVPGERDAANVIALLMRSVQWKFEGDSASARYVELVDGQGYRFNAASA